MIEKLTEAFKREDVKKAVLDDKWFKINKELNIDSAGFCYAASEVIYRKTGEKEIYKLGRISEKKWDDGGHCYLIKKSNDEKVDITKNQYTERNISIPYELAHIGGGFRYPNKTRIAEILSEMAGLGSFDK